MKTSWFVDLFRDEVWQTKLVIAGVIVMLLLVAIPVFFLWWWAIPWVIWPFRGALHALFGTTIVCSDLRLRVIFLIPWVLTQLFAATFLCHSPWRLTAFWLVIFCLTNFCCSYFGLA